MSITTQVLLTLFATLTLTSGEPSDLCDIVHADTGKPTFCEPHKEGAPRYNGTVCCDEQTCFEAGEGYCLANEELFYCKLGEVQASSEVRCYFEVLNYCESFPCQPGLQAYPQGNFMCCYQGICWNTFTDSNDCEVQDIYWCDDGVTNQDGTVTCFD